MEKIEFWLLDGKKEIAHYEASLAFHEGNKILSHLQKFLNKYSVIPDKALRDPKSSKKSKDPDFHRDDKSSVTKTNSYKLTAISLYSGPGSYTGLRIGRAIASALSLSWNVPLKMIK